MDGVLELLAEYFEGSAVGDDGHVVVFACERADDGQRACGVAEAPGADRVDDLHLWLRISRDVKYILVFLIHVLNNNRKTIFF